MVNNSGAMAASNCRIQRPLNEGRLSGDLIAVISCHYLLGVKLKSKLKIYRWKKNNKKSQKNKNAFKWNRKCQPHPKEQIQLQRYFNCYSAANQNDKTMNRLQFFFLLFLIDMKNTINQDGYGQEIKCATHLKHTPSDNGVITYGITRGLSIRRWDRLPGVGTRGSKSPAPCTRIPIAATLCTRRTPSGTSRNTLSDQLPVAPFTALLITTICHSFTIIQFSKKNYSFITFFLKNMFFFLNLSN